MKTDPLVMTAPVLIVERHTAHRASLEAALCDGFADLEVVDSGEAALVRLGMTNFGCIVLGSPIAVDFAGESSTMLELFDRIAPNLAHRLVVVANARATAVLQRAVAMQVHSILIDPFDPEELCDSVQRCVRGDPPPHRFRGAAEGVVEALRREHVATRW